MTKRAAPIFSVAALIFSVAANAAPILNEPLRPLHEIQFVIKTEGTVNSFVGAKAKLYSFETGAESEIQLMKNGKLVATMALPVDGPDPINVQVAGILKLPEGKTCELSGAQDILASTDLRTAVIRTVCEIKPAQ